MWIKQDFRRIGNDAAGELTVTNDIAAGFTFTKPVNPTVASDITAYIAAAKTALNDFQNATTVKAFEDAIVSTIITNLNK